MIIRTIRLITSSDFGCSIFQILLMLLYYIPVQSMLHILKFDYSFWSVFIFAVLLGRLTFVLATVTFKFNCGLDYKIYKSFQFWFVTLILFLQLIWAIDFIYNANQYNRKQALKDINITKANESTQLPLMLNQNYYLLEKSKETK